MANKIYYNLDKTPFKHTINDYEFYFSSVFHRNKFIKNVDNYINEESIKFKNKYKVEIDLSDVFMINYYMKVETRGFKVLYQCIPLDTTLKNIII